MNAEDVKFNHMNTNLSRAEKFYLNLEWGKKHPDILQ